MGVHGSVQPQAQREAEQRGHRAHDAQRPVGGDLVLTTLWHPVPQHKIIPAVILTCCRALAWGMMGMMGMMVVLWGVWVWVLVLRFL
jgi:hypothetical protein